MLRLSKKLLFGIEAVVDIASHAGTGPVRSTDISRRQGIPRRYLEQVLQELVRKSVLSGQRGPRGGGGEIRGGFALGREMAPLDAGTRPDPFVGCVQRRFEFTVRHDAFGQVMPDALTHGACCHSALLALPSP